MAASNILATSFPQLLGPEPGDLNDLGSWRSIGGGSSGVFTPGSYATPTGYWTGETSSANTKTIELAKISRLRANKVVLASAEAAALAVQTKGNIYVRARRTGTPNTLMTLAAKVARMTGAAAIDTSIGTAGQLVTTAAQNLLSIGVNTWNLWTFEVDLQSLLAGDLLFFGLQGVNDDSGGGGGGAIEIGEVRTDWYHHGW